MHWDVEVTSGAEDQQSIVSQAFCSALPVSYNQASKTTWTRFAKLVLESVYEATILAAVLNRKKPVLILFSLLFWATVLLATKRLG